MGLDMYAYTLNKDFCGEDGEKQVDLESSLFLDGHARDYVNPEFFYWRKFNHLHGWMERLYREKGGTQEVFNCVTVRLMPEDIDRLEADLNATLSGEENKLPHTKVFFGGGEEMYQGDIEALRKFIAACRDAFGQNLAVVYDSWW